MPNLGIVVPGSGQFNGFGASQLGFEGASGDLATHAWDTDAWTFPPFGAVLDGFSSTSLSYAPLVLACGHAREGLLVV